MLAIVNNYVITGDKMKTNSFSDKVNLYISDVQNDFSIVFGKKSKVADWEIKKFAIVKLGALAIGTAVGLYALTAIPSLLAGAVIFAVTKIAFCALSMAVVHDVYQMAKYEQSPVPVKEAQEGVDGVFGATNKGFKSFKESVQNAWEGKTSVFDIPNAIGEGIAKGWDERQINSLTGNTFLKPVWKLVFSFKK